MHKLRSLLGPLRVFDAVQRTGGISSAAKVLHVTPGAVSQQLQALENKLGVRLFEKDGRGVRPTDTGLMLGRRVEDLFDRVESAVMEAAQAGNTKRLRLELSPSLAILWLMPRFASFTAAHPEIDVEIATTSAPNPDSNLDQFDFVVRHGDGQWTDVEMFRLFDDAFIPVCAPKLATSVSTADDFSKHTLLHSMMRPEAWDLWAAAAGIERLPRRKDVILANAALCYQAAANGVGIAIAQRAYVEDDLRTGRLVAAVDITTHTSSSYYLVCDRRRGLSLPAQAFKEWLARGP